MREGRFGDLYAETAAGFLGCGCQLSDDLEPDGIAQGIEDSRQSDIVATGVIKRSHACIIPFPMLYFHCSIVYEH